MDKCRQRILGVYKVTSTFYGYFKRALNKQLFLANFFLYSLLTLLY